MANNGQLVVDKKETALHVDSVTNTLLIQTTNNGQLVVDKKETALHVDSVTNTLLIQTTNNSLVVDATKRGVQGVAGEVGELFISIEAGENLLSHKPLAVIGNKAYLLDASNLEHLNAYAGMSMNGAVIGSIVQIQQIGIITLNGWGLTPNTQYLAGKKGSLVTVNTTELFSKNIGFSVDENSLQIIKDSKPTIRQND